MSRESMLIVVGILVMLSPFSGFPLSLLTWLYLFIGLVIVGIGISFRLAHRRRAKKNQTIHEAASTIS